MAIHASRQIGTCLFLLSLSVPPCILAQSAAPQVQQPTAPQVHKVAAPHGLKPLPMDIGGRTLITTRSSDVGTHQYTSQWPGSYFRAGFQGSAVYFGVGPGNEILHIVVDGTPLSPLVKPQEGTYGVDGLHNGSHTISALVATESQDAPNTFLGFAVPAGEQALTPPQRPRSIEFIGDSHTVGYGDLSPTRQCTKDQIWSDTDNTRSFSALTAQHYNAEYQVNAISGRGIVRNYNGFQGDTIPEAYPYVLFNHQDRYQDPTWKPQVVVIALGTNDFSTPLNPGEHWKTREALHADYEATYAKFLQQLRARDPEAYIVVWATDAAKGEVEAESNKVVQQRRQAGDLRIIFLPINGLAFSACDAHPSLADEKTITDKLIQQIDIGNAAWRKEPESPK